jgi:hypothetical protein
MINRLFGTSARLVHSMASQPVTSVNVVKATRGLLTTAQHTLTVFGLSAVAMLALLYARPDFAKRVSEMLYAQEPRVVVVQPALSAMVDPNTHAVEATEAAATDDKLLGNSKQQQWVTSWLSKKYRVADDAARLRDRLSTGHDLGLVPFQSPDSCSVRALPAAAFGAQL